MNGILPDGWAWATLGEVTKINGRDVAIRDLPDDLSVTFLPMAAVDAEQGYIAQPEIRPLKEVRKGFTPFSDGDVLLAKITPSMENGKAAIARKLQNGRGFGSTEFHVFRPKEVVTAEWVFHFIRQEMFRKDAKAHFSGTAGQLRVPTNFLIDYPVPVPPLFEQKRIVAKIEELFTQLDAGTAALKRVQAGLKRYKASVLKAAVEGRLFKNREVESRDELPDGWKWTTIGDVIDSLDNMRVPVNKKERENRQGEYPYYGANGQVDWIDGYIFDEPLVLLVEDETFTGREKPFSYKITGKTWVNNHAHVLRAKANILDVDYLNYSLAYYPFTPMTTGTTGRKKLTKSAMMAAPYALPPLAEQQRIVAEVERRLEGAAQVETTLAAALARASRLRQAVLKSAFEGRLG